ncbi:MAG: hypothetical protein OXG62_02160 [Nitrospinae bacterium]|nr:hypothetical protein [Nitrospinota bacterium]
MISTRAAVSSSAWFCYSPRAMDCFVPNLIIERRADRDLASATATPEATKSGKTPVEGGDSSIFFTSWQYLQERNHEHE